MPPLTEDLLILPMCMYVKKSVTFTGENPSKANLTRPGLGKKEEERRRKLGLYKRHHLFPNKMMNKPTCVQVIKAEEIGKQDAGYTKGMSRKSGLVGCSEKMCSLVMDAEPNSSSSVHHHGDQDTIVYALSGRGYIAYGPDPSQRHEILPGDHALIPAFVEHQEVNPTDQPIRWIIIRSGSQPKTENLQDWTK